MPEQESMGALIRQIRQQRNMSQAALARSLGKDRRIMSRFERGQQTPDCSELEALAKGLKVPLMWLYPEYCPYDLIGTLAPFITEERPCTGTLCGRDV